MTKGIIEETNNTKAANKFLMQGSITIIAMKHQDGTITHNKTEILSLATNFYRDLYQSQTKVEPIVHRKQIEEPLEDITEEKVQKTIKKLRNKKSPGPDGVANKLLKSAASLVRKSLAHLMNPCLQNKTIPSD